MAFSVHDPAAFEGFARRRRVDPTPLRRVAVTFLKHARGVDAALAGLPDELRRAALDDLEFHALALRERHDSALDGATKLIFRTADGYDLETVILRVATGRTTLCLSSQVGCAAGCSFCATGTMGLRRNLRRDEILDQVVQASQIVAAEGRRVRNLVFMGMGEPLHNEAVLHEALEALTDPHRLEFSPRKIIVSTVGEPAAMLRLAERFPNVSQALSLHAARDEVRRVIVPHARRTSAAELRATVRRILDDTGRPMMIEYVMLAGRNDGPEDLAALVAWLEGLRVHVNLIPYNPSASNPGLVGTSKADREAFARGVRAAGHVCTVRYSFGSDIEAACGQLVKDIEARPRAAGT